MLLTLGPKVNGYPHDCHGDIVGTMIDEAMGSPLTVNKILKT